MNPFFRIFLFWLLLMLSGCLPDQAVVPEEPRFGGTPRIPTSFARLITDTIGGMPVLTVGKITSRSAPGTITGNEPIEWDFVVAFENRDGRQFQVIQDSLPALLRDKNGTVWSVEGIGLAGPETGNRLTPANGSLGYWYAFATRYPGLSINGGPSLDVDVQHTTEPDWDVPTQTIVRGAQRDAIKSIERPSFVRERERIQEPYRWSDDEVVIGISINGISRCYPLEILNWHEIVNDEIGGIPITVSYHPYTSTTRVWKRDELTPSFGVTGLLYEHNMLLYDRNTISRWIQMENRCVNGIRRGETIDIIPFVETTFGTWKQIAPDTRILSSQTGFPFFYDEDPLPGFATNEQFLTAPITYDDDRLPRKERVFGLIIGGEAVVYTQKAFQ
jgi:hypothetical protein